MGYPDAQTAMTNVHGRQVTGGSFPAQIWAKFMRAALERQARDGLRQAGRPQARHDLPRDRHGRDRVLPTHRLGLFLARTTLKSCTKHVDAEEDHGAQPRRHDQGGGARALEKLKLGAKVVEKSVEGVAAGVVADQTPAAGSTATTQTVVTLTVSNGGVSTTPPDRGLRQRPQPPSPARRSRSTARASSDDGKIAKWYWEFGDGATAQGKKATHTWAAPGTYEVTLWVTDDAGQQALGHQADRGGLARGPASLDESST